MRKISDVIDQILAQIPAPMPAEIVDDLIVLGAELRILRRTGSYTPPEAADDAALWQRLATTCYRYLPSPDGYPFAKNISTIILGA